MSAGGAHSRRRVLQGAAVLAGAIAVPIELAGEASAAWDPEQRYLRLVPGGNGIIYGQQADGRLRWFRHRGHLDGTASWVSTTGREIGSGWQSYTTLLASGDGQLFGFSGDGSVRWHKYVVSNRDTGAGSWAAGGGSVIHTGFGRFSYVFGGRNGVIYAVDQNGDMYWFRYRAGNGDGSPGAWARNGVGARIATGRRNYEFYFADRDGVIYGRRKGNHLDWFRYVAQDGSNGPGAWANGGEPISIARGFGWASTVERFAADGALYGVQVDKVNDPPGPDHQLYWYRLANWRTVATDGKGIWRNGGNGVKVGERFTVNKMANLQGYADWSVTNGQTLPVAVSTVHANYRVSVLRLDGPMTREAQRNPARGVHMVAPFTRTGRFQPLRTGYRANGCGWQPDFNVTVGQDWQSGYYAVQLSGPQGLRHYIPFVVRPPQPVAPLAVLMPFMTYNAYNHWGGHYQYSWDRHPRRLQLTTRRPFAHAYIERPGFMDVHMYGDLLLLRWLADNKIAYDCYTDLDLHNDDSWLAGHKALVLASHPEYWTATMRARLERYLATGGRVIYTGGNGIYERVELTADGSAVLHRDTAGERWTWRRQGEPETELLGVAFNGASYMKFAPYQVDSMHPFLEGTGLSVGDQFGHTGYNFAASGLEVDTMDGAGTPPVGPQRIAHGTQYRGSDMIYWDKGNGGWVFSVGSLSYNGSLAYDPATAQILRNAITAAVVE